MPKKTRQQKIISQLRRLQDTQVQKPDQPSPVVKLKDLATPQVAAIKKEPLSYRYVFTDLRKTVIFVAGAIIFEVVLSLTLFKG